ALDVPRHILLADVPKVGDSAHLWLSPEPLGHPTSLAPWVLGVILGDASLGCCGDTFPPLGYVVGSGGVPTPWTWMLGVPFYYEMKMAFVLWLLSPYTRGASLLYRKFVHPTLSRKEKEIDTYIIRAKERSYEAMVGFGKRGLNLAATAAVQAATKGQGVLAGRLRSFSLQDLRSIPDQTPLHYQDPLYLEEQETPRQLLGFSPRYESETEDDELWSDSRVSPPPRDPRPLSRSHSLRTAKKKTPAKE
ncbi:PREDICTED: receptor expression-enhancing protein 4-like, partial [Chaetura pelagica]